MAVVFVFGVGAFAGFLFLVPPMYAHLQQRTKDNSETMQRLSEEQARVQALAKDLSTRCGGG